MTLLSSLYIAPKILGHKINIPHLASPIFPVVLLVFLLSNVKISLIQKFSNEKNQDHTICICVLDFQKRIITW